MFRLMHFFMSFHHQMHQAAVKDAVGAGRKGGDSPKFELGYVLETMDLMSFNLVLREVETAIAEKNTKRVADCVAVLKEMMHIVVSGGCLVIFARTLLFTEARAVGDEGAVCCQLRGKFKSGWFLRLCWCSFKPKRMKLVWFLAVSICLPTSLILLHAIPFSSLRIQTMLNESSEKPHQLVALGLLATIFYASEPLGEVSTLMCVECVLSRCLFSLWFLLMKMAPIAFVRMIWH